VRALTAAGRGSRRRLPAPLLAALALLGCAAGAVLRIEESEAFGADRVRGVVRQTPTDARLEGDGRRVRLVQAAPQTARSLESLLAETAAALRGLDGRRVAFTGELQGDVLWLAEPEDPGAP
jgi:hypothetical protein